MDEGIKDINQKITFFKRKYYLNLFTRGAILAPAIVLGYYVVAILLEHNLWLSKPTRFLIFSLFLLLVIFCILYFFKKPIQWWFYKRGLSQEESAKIIGKHFPSIGDRLLNIIQLASQKKNPLLDASINQKSGQLKEFPFEKAVNLNANKKYLRYLTIPICIIVILAFVNSNIFTGSTARIVKFNQEFSPEAPFKFTIDNSKLKAFFNEDFTLNVSLTGKALPESAYLISGGQRWKLENHGDGKFQYVFEKIQQPVSFQVEASGFYSSSHQIEIANRPEVLEIKISLDFPAYTGRRDEQITNVGNIEIPEGTHVTWRIKGSHTKSAKISFASAGDANPMEETGTELFSFGKKFNNNDQYSISMENESSDNKDKISYSIDVVKDQFPQIFVENLRDSVLYKSVLLGGQVKDDYSVTELQLFYEISSGGQAIKKSSIKIPIAPGRPQQNFFYSWSVDSLKLNPGEQLSYYFEVWDNDGVNGRKSTKSASYVFSMPSKEELKVDIANQQQVAEHKIDKSVQKAKDLKQSIDEAQQKLKGKQNLDWQDKKMLEELIDQKQKLDQAIKDLQKENELLEQKKESFTEENERIKEKSEQIQKLMDELLDDETKKLFNDLEKLLKENMDIQQVQKMLEKMDRKEINLEKELERTLELFKELQYEYKLDQATNEIKSQAEKQEELMKETQKLESEKKGNNKKESTENNENKSEKSNEDLAKEQESLKDDLKKFEKSVEDLKKLSEELSKDDITPDKQELDQLENSEDESQKSLQQNDLKKSQEQQQKSLNQMKEMQKKMQQAQNSMQMEMDAQNLESLRQIVHGLIKLSYDQESLMKEFNSIQQSDPKYPEVAQRELSIQNDAKVLEDSLLALAKKDPFMGSVVTREIGDLNDHVSKAVNNIKERRKGNVSTEMQFSMSSINNLALMLNDHFDMMMNMMANAMPSKGKGKKGKNPMPNFGKMQQKLNEEIQQLKNGQKSGRGYSEELARMAAEQERIRRALQEMQEKLKKEGGAQIGNDLPGKMEQTELDLVNKNITEQTIRRQKEILTRLLEAEKSMREKELDNERKGETAKDYSKEMPRAFEEYLRLKEKEVELLKTLPPKLFPYYKKEVTEYFKRIN